MVESGWRMDLGQQGREMWRKMLRPYDAAMATKALVLLVERQRERPAIADLRGMILKLRMDERESEPLPERVGKPSWVTSWEKAKAAGDPRYFVEQIPGLAELDAQNDYDGAYAIPSEPVTDEKVWVQIGEYGYEGCAYDFAAPPDSNRLCAMHPHARTAQPLKLTTVGKHAFMLCMDCRERYLDRLCADEGIFV
jgi:hypothetical protein